MVPALIVLGIVLAAAVLIAVQVTGIYNKLVALDQQCENGFSQISVQLKRRYDLIPNLVETVRGYMEHESDTLESVIAARNQASQQLSAATDAKSGGAVKQWMGAEKALTGALGRMSFVMENYPELKANESVASLMEELQSTENKIAFARQAYNDWGTTFNRFRLTFPNVLFADKFGYAENRELLEFEDQPEIQNAPDVALAASAN